MASGIKIIKDALVESGLKKIPNGRDALRQMTCNGAITNSILLDLALGRAWQATLPDGQVSAPMIPSSDVRLRAAMFLHEAEFGRAVPATEVGKADQDARERAAINAMTDDELAAEAERILAGRRALPAQVETEAELVEDLSLDNVDAIAERIWQSTEAD